MFNHTITQNENQTATKQSWETHGYTLSIVTHDDGHTYIAVNNPMKAPSIFVHDFGFEDKTVVVNWSALGSRNPAEAREYADQIITATEVAEKFQEIIDAM